MIRIAIVDDHPIIRSGLRDFLSQQPGLTVVAEAADGSRVTDLVRDNKVDVLILDITMPNFNGIDALASLAAGDVDTSVLMYSGLPEENYAVSMLHKGALGYLNKACPPQQVIDAVRTVASKRQYLSPSLRDAQDHHLLTPIDGYPHEDLSARELQVFIRLAKGEGCGEIGRALHVSERTVAKHRKNTLMKLRLGSDEDLARYATKYDLID